MVKRYDKCLITYDIIQVNDGDFVLYEDYKKLEEKYKELKRLNDILEEDNDILRERLKSK